MISRKGTRTSGASSGVTQILREAGSGPVVTAGSVVSGLDRMFMVYPPVILISASSHGRRHPEVRALASLEGWSRAVALRRPLKKRPPQADGSSSVVLYSLCRLRAVAEPL